MKNIKKAMAFISALALTGTAAACGSTSEITSSETTVQTTETTPAKELDEDDKAAVAEMDIGDDQKLENGTVKWLSFWDLNPANGKPKSVELELFETKYGGKIEYIPTTYETRYNDLSTQVLGGTSPDLFPAADLDTFPGKAISGMFEPIDDYLDFDSELWGSGAKKLSDEHALGGKHYVAVVSTDARCVCIYNKKTIEENGLSDPAELLAEDNWNWDTFKEMCAEFSDPDNKKHGFDGWWFETNLLLTTGKPVIDMTDGVITSNISDTSIERCENSIQSDEKSDSASCAQALCGVALSTI